MRSIAVTVTILILLFACDYEPTGENFVVKPQPDATGLSVELTDTSDTLFVFGNAEIRYSSITKNKSVLWFRASLNGEQFGTHNQGSASVFLYTLGLSNGCYPLRIELILSSGTGSLAEVRGMEELHVERNYVVCVDNAQPDPVEITSIRHTDGTLELVWEKYKKQNFQKYRIFKLSYNMAYHYFENHWLKEITEPETTSLRDSTFIGGKVKYVITVVAADKESYPAEKEFEDPYDINPTWQWGDKTNGTVTWRKTRYYKNFTSYTVSFNNGIGDPRLFTLTNVNDTTITLDSELIFSVGARATVIAYPVRIDNYHYDYVYGHAEGIHLGKTFPWYFYPDPYIDQTTYNPSLGKYFALYHYEQTQLIRINGTTNNVEQNFVVPPGGNFHLSDNGQYLYVMQGDEFTRINPSTFSIIQSYNVSSLCGSNGGSNWQSSLSGSNRLALTYINGSFVLDMNSFSIVQQWPYDGKTIQISPTGTYVIRGNEILKWNSTQYVSVGNVGGTRKRIFVENDSKVLLDKIDRVEVLNLTTMSVERTITLEGGYNLRYDPTSGLLGGYTDPFSGGPLRFYLYNLNSNTKIKDFPVAGYMVLLNSSLVAPGSILPISFYYP